MLTLSEDAGLRIRSLNDFPGAYTKRFVEQSGGLKNAFDQLEALLSMKKDRYGEFVCVSVMYDPETKENFIGKGMMSGEIRFPPRGTQGFGFDPIFVPDGYEKTIAELGEAIKTTLGHRGKSMRTLLKNYDNRNSNENKL
jgi:XTP/dITP diphosphohydrolase